MSDEACADNGGRRAQAAAGAYQRRDVLKALAAAGVVGAVGSNLLSKEAFAQAAASPRAAFGPTELTFSTTERYRPVFLLAENFVQLDDGFDSDTSSNYEALEPAPETNGAHITVGDGTLAATGESSYFQLFRSDTAQLAPCSTVIVDVVSFSDSAATQNAVFAGLVKNEANYVVAWYDHLSKKVGVDVTVGGQLIRLGETDADLPSPMRFAFVLQEMNVIALADTGAGFQPLITENMNIVVRELLLDLRRPATLAEYHNGFGVRGDTGTIVLDGVQAGYYGEVGVRDPNIVTWADGTPYIAGGKLYLTQTNAGLVGNNNIANDSGVRAAHFAVYTLDLSDYTKLEEVGKIFFNRDDRVLGDTAGHVVFDDEFGGFRVYVSTWGDFPDNGVKIAYAETRRDVLHGITVLDDVSILPIPTVMSVYDPHVVRIGAEWYITYTETHGYPFGAFYPALAKDNSGEFPSPTVVGKDAFTIFTEGTKLQKVGGNWYVLASNDFEYRVWDLTMRFVGKLDAPHPTAIPHPMVVPVPVGGGRGRGRTKYILITFDGTQYGGLGPNTRGDFFVMEADETIRGYEFKPRRPPGRRPGKPHR